ncbi:DUF4297 domain-containing protein [Pseudomonas sp. IT-P253]|uniref:ABC-three component system protein n=1 Tax=Pseudomonas sp. IT-P253 TaxID=3026455 RepID=UPI0039DF8D37
MAKNEIEEKLPHTAVATWGGYIYQGKIALYYCLALMLENAADSKKFTLQLDSIDDFAILLDGVCQSMHQVKAYKSDDFSAYAGAIKDQLEKSKGYPGSKVLFHSSKNVVVPDDFLVIYSPVAFYSYNKGAGAENYCGLSEVDSLLEKLIGDFYSKYDPSSGYKISSEYLQWSRNLLEDIVVSKIISMHAEIQLTDGAVQRQVASREKISFSIFLDVLSTELTSAILCESYFFSVILKDIGNYYIEFCEENELEDEDLYKLGRCVARINKFDIGRLKIFMRSTLPSKKGRFNSLAEYKDETLSSDDFQFGLFKIFDDLIESEFDGGGRSASFYWELSGGSFYPTAIHQGKQSTGAVCKKIVDNAIKHDVEFLYESGTLITTDIDADSIFSVVNVGARGGGLQDHKKFNKFKDVALVSIANLPSGIKK